MLVYRQYLRAKSFNPRTHVGCDYTFPSSSNISICFNPRTHVGCDRSKSEALRGQRGFQSTHPRRVRHLVGATPGKSQMFQSTHPRRVRLRLWVLRLPSTSFNPRTHVGCDVDHESYVYSSACFNPRTHVGCDMLTFSLTKRIASFNPRTHVGCDCNLRLLSATRAVSIHAPT